MYSVMSLLLTTAKISKIRIKTITACSNRTDGEKTSAGGQHRRVGHVDISTHLRPVQRHLLDTLQVTPAMGLFGFKYRFS